MKKTIKILTNHPGQVESPSWEHHTTYIPFESNSWIASIKLAFKLFFKRKDHDCVVIGANRSNIIFSLLQTLFPFRKTPCIMIDCLWYKSNSKIRGFFKKILMKIVDISIDKYIVWASHEIKDYANLYELDEGKFLFIPYHTTLDLLPIISKDEGYLFSGGNFSRDYRTLVQAVQGLSVKLYIATTRPELFENIPLKDNIVVKGYSHEDYIKKMAGCAVNIVALETGLLHSGGQQTFLNSMYLGKPTIVTDLKGAPDYIESGKDGILTEGGDVPSLRQAITYLMDNPEIAAKMGKRAKDKVKDYSTEKHFKKIINLAEDLISAK